MYIFKHISISKYTISDGSQRNSRELTSDDAEGDLGITFSETRTIKSHKHIKIKTIYRNMAIIEGPNVLFGGYKTSYK